MSIRLRRLLHRAINIFTTPRNAGRETGGHAVLQLV
jgi:hypothetical protein